MSSETYPNLDEVERQVERTTVSQHRKELGIMENLLNDTLAGFRMLGSFTPSEDNEREFALLLLTTRSFNSTRWAYALLKQGYYSQSLMLIRSVDEDCLTATDSEENPDTLKAVLKGVGELRKGKLIFANMARRVSKDYYEGVWKDNYGQLSEIAHPRRLALLMLYDPDTHILRLGAHYDRALFIGTCHALAQAEVQMIGCLSKVLSRVIGSKAESWQKQSLPHLELGTAWMKNVEGRLQRGEAV